MAGGSLVEEEESSKRVCAACGLRISLDKNVCPRCGNVFRKDEGDWEWKLIPKKRTPKKTIPQKERDEDADDD